MEKPHNARIGQLKRALDSGVIDQDTFDATAAGLRAGLPGGSAIA